MKQLVLFVAALVLACGPIDQSGGSGSGASPDGGGADGGVASAGGGGGAPADCSGVMPGDLGSPPVVTNPHGGGDVCWDATSDLSGNVAAESHPGSMGGAFVGTWQIWSGSGQSRGMVQRGEPTFLGQQEGFQGPQGNDLVQWSPSGDALRRSSLDDKCAHDAFYSATGGTLVLERCGSRLKALRFDAQGGQRAAAEIGDASAASGVVDAQDRALIAFSQEGRYAARWYDANLNPASAQFNLPGNGSSQPMVRPLIGGGGAIQIDGNWVATSQSGAASADAPPDFLASHRNYDLQIIRQGRAYALIPRAGASPHDTLDLWSGAGQHCGSVKFPTDGLSVGPDGTVIGSAGDAGCTHAIWSGLLR